MTMMKPLAFAAVLAVLAGCAATEKKGVGPLDSLRKEVNLRTERVVLSTFPQIQLALFKHQAACGVTYTFRLDPHETSYASVVYMPAAESSGEVAVLADLAWYQPTFRQEQRVKFTVYTEYKNQATEDRIQALFRAIDQPDQCTAS
ncbi:MAG: hypothetical protein AB7E12_08865 [Burkholderiaceae bacterium]